MAKGKKSEQIDQFLDTLVPRGGGRPNTPVFGFDAERPPQVQNPLRRGRAPSLREASSQSGFPGVPDEVSGLLGG